MSHFLGTTSVSFNCPMPSKACQMATVHAYKSFFSNEKNFRHNVLGIRCDIDKTAEETVSFLPFPTNHSCFINETFFGKQILEIRWQSKRRAILDRHFSIDQFLDYSTHFESRIDINLVNLNGFDLNLFEYPNSQNIGNLICLRCKFNFYNGQRLMKSCRDITISTISSIFQIENRDYFILGECEFKEVICPLVFNNSKIRYLIVTNLIDLFYKTSTIRFSNETEAENSNIREMEIFIENISLDLNLLNPSVFRNLLSLTVKGSVKSIDAEIFNALERLFVVNIETIHFRKLVHKTGIEWIRGINSELHVNLSDWDDIGRYFNIKNIEMIVLSCEAYKYEERISNVFPDEDFCLYADYPFDQLVLLFQGCSPPFQSSPDFTCTYLWITQYIAAEFIQVFSNRSSYYESMMRIRNSEAFESIWKCDFEHRLSLCRDYKINSILGISDFVDFNKRLVIFSKISTYIVCLFGIAGNILVILVICHKCNRELFKEFKQYHYLWINAVFSLLILTIEILCWINECFYPYEIFCPEIRKLVAIQFFKILFKECLVTSFRFMCSFCYVAFALNRIGREHDKIVKFMSDVKVVYFILVTTYISFGLSVVKYFKYEVNYDEIESTFPASNEHDILVESYLRFSNLAYFILNSLSDFLNYVIFVVVCFVVDVCMVVQLKRTLEEKNTIISSVSKNTENKRKENEEIIKKAIRMVVLNTAIAIVLKVPSSFLPVLNLSADFYFRSFDERYKNSPGFGQFYSRFIYGGFYPAIEDLSTLLYCVSLSIQVFIYLIFDKKFKGGFDNFKIVVLKKNVVTK